MWDFIKRNIFILIIFATTLLLGFITFFTFLDKSFINLNQENLNYLLYANIILLILFFILILLAKSIILKNATHIRSLIEKNSFFFVQAPLLNLDKKIY